MIPVSTNPFRKEPVIAERVIISSDVLEVSKSGKKVLKYLIENHMLKQDYVRIDIMSVLDYMAFKYGVGYANRQNVKRGIQDLIDCDILAKDVDSNSYYINKRYISQ